MPVLSYVVQRATCYGTEFIYFKWYQYKVEGTDLNLNCGSEHSLLAQSREMTFTSSQTYILISVTLVELGNTFVCPCSFIISIQACQLGAGFNLSVLQPAQELRRPSVHPQCRMSTGQMGTEHFWQDAFNVTRRGSDFVPTWWIQAQVMITEQDRWLTFFIWWSWYTVVTDHRTALNFSVKQTWAKLKRKTKQNSNDRQD